MSNISNLDESQLLELVDLYMEFCEKQDEVIYRLSKIASKQATDIQHFKNLQHYIDNDLEQECKEAAEALEQYKEMKEAK